MLWHKQGPPQGLNLHLPKSTPKSSGPGRGRRVGSSAGWSWIPVLQGEAAGREDGLSWDSFVFREAKIQELPLGSEGFLSLWKAGNSSLGMQGQGGSKSLPGSGMPPAGSSTCALGWECWWRESSKCPENKICALSKPGVVEFHAGMKTRPRRLRVCFFGVGIFPFFEWNGVKT